MSVKTSAVRIALLSPNEVKIIELLTMEERKQILLKAGREKLVQLINEEEKQEKSEE